MHTQQGDWEAFGERHLGIQGGDAFILYIKESEKNFSLGK